MKTTKKLIALLVTLIMTVGLVPSFGGAETSAGPMTASEREEKIAALSEFTDKVAEITTVYDKDLDSKKGEGEFALCRIIVKAAGKLSDESAVAEASGYNDWHVFQYATPEEAQAACKRFNMTEGVEWAEPDEVMYAFATPGSSSFRSWGFGASHINMYEYNQWLYAQYGNNLSNLPEIIVAVVDTGADSDHPFLVDRLVPGWNFVNNTNNPEDGHSHGTHVSGTIVDGTFSNVKIMPIKVLSDSGSGSTLNVGLGMEYGSLHGAQVENLSLGGTCDGGEEHHFMAEIIDCAFDNGTTIVVAAGNDAVDAGIFCPANIERVCTVASIGQSHNISYFSNFGPCVDIAAPGESISSSIPGGSYGTKDGTSMASPHVAAVAAQIKSANPNMDADEVISVIKGAAQPISANNVGAGMAHLAADMYGLDPAANAAGSNNHFVSSGSYAWTADGSSVVSGNAGVNNTSSVMTCQLSVGYEQVLTFDCKVSSEQNKDYFRVKANGTTLFERSGEYGWQTQSVTIPGSGSVTLTFEFSKDGSGASGSDKAWVRNVKVGASLPSAVNITGGTVQFTSSGEYPWVANDTENAGMSGNAGVHNSESVMTCTITLKKGMILTFKYKVSAASGDNLLFKFDGRIAATLGATEDYEDFEYNVPNTGEHQISFVFKKNASGSSGSDRAYVKCFAFYHSFESAINGTDDFLPFFNEGQYPWCAYYDYVSSTNWSSDSSESSFTLTLAMNRGETLSFRYRSSSEDNYDYFRFYVDGAEQIKQAGDHSEWSNYTFTASATTTYVFQWSFTKDVSVGYYDDAAYVDEVIYSGHYTTADGDADGDGDVDSVDALLILRYVLNLIGPDDLELDRCDVNGDGVVDSVDATIIMRLAMGLN